MAGTGLGWAFLRWVTRQVRAEEADLDRHKDEELERLRAEVTKCRAESFAMQIKFGMLVGLARKNGWEIPAELLD